jgi:probable sporulation protein (polysaccharide deacetylase family)
MWWFVELSGPVDAFVSEVKTRSGQFAWSWGGAQHAFFAEGAAAGLEERVRAEAKRRYVAPIDAKVDRVWKAIPGYNGVEVDIEQSLKLAAQHPDQDPPPVVTREIPPKVQLDDLGPYPIYKGNPHKPMVALMINVAWGEEYLPGMLDTLRKEHVHATFFFDGSWLSQHLETAKQIGEQGHELSNHAYSHKNMSRLSAAQARSEISKTETLLTNRLGVNNRWFAPPSGDFDDETVRIAAGEGLKTVLWTLDTLDWRNPGAATIIRKIGSRVEPGSLILMHPTASSSAALESMIRAIKSKGLALGTVSEVLSPERVE